MNGIVAVPGQPSRPTLGRTLGNGHGVSIARPEAAKARGCCIANNLEVLGNVVAASMLELIDEAGAWAGAGDAT
jgi:hypothetical protein